MRAASGNINPLVLSAELQLGIVWDKMIKHYSSISTWSMHLSRKESLELMNYLARPNTPEWIPAMVKGLEKLGHTDYLILKLVKAARLAKRKRGRHGR